MGGTITPLQRTHDTQLLYRMKGDKKQTYALLKRICNSVSLLHAAAIARQRRCESIIKMRENEPQKFLCRSFDRLEACQVELEEDCLLSSLFLEVPDCTLRLLLTASGNVDFSVVIQKSLSGVKINWSVQLHIGMQAYLCSLLSNA